MQRCINLFRKNPTDSFDLCQLLGTGTDDLSSASEVPEQCPSAFWSHTLDALKYGFRSFFATPVSVRSDSKSVTFISNVLDQVQCRIVRRQVQFRSS